MAQSLDEYLGDPTPDDAQTDFSVGIVLVH